MILQPTSSLPELTGSMPLILPTSVSSGNKEAISPTNAKVAKQKGRITITDEDGIRKFKFLVFKQLLLNNNFEKIDYQAPSKIVLETLKKVFGKKDNFYKKNLAFGYQVGISTRHFNTYWGDILNKKLSTQDPLRWMIEKFIKKGSCKTKKDGPLKKVRIRPEEKDGLEKFMFLAFKHLLKTKEIKPSEEGIAVLQSAFQINDSAYFKEIISCGNNSIVAKSQLSEDWTNQIDRLMKLQNPHNMLTYLFKNKICEVDLDISEEMSGAAQGRKRRREEYTQEPAEVSICSSLQPDDTGNTTTSSNACTRPDASFEVPEFMLEWTDEAEAGFLSDSIAHLPTSQPYKSLVAALPAEQFQQKEQASPFGNGFLFLADLDESFFHTDTEYSQQNL